MSSWLCKVTTEPDIIHEIAKMGQPISKLNKGEREEEKRDDAKLGADMEKQREKIKREGRVSNERKGKQEKLNSKTSPISQETKPSTNNTLMTKSVCPVVSVNKKDELDKHCFEKKRDYSGNNEINANIDNYNSENGRKNKFDVEGNTRKHDHKVRACQMDRFDDEDTAKGILDKEIKTTLINDDEKSEKQLPQDCFRLHRGLKKENKISAQSAIMQQELNWNINDQLMLLGTADDVEDKAGEKFEKRHMYKESDKNNLVNKTELKKMEIDFHVVNQKACIDIKCLNVTLRIVTLKLSVKSIVFSFAHVYVIGVPSASLLHYSYGDQRFIKGILKKTELKKIHLQNEQFRLATFSLSPQRFEMGETLKLAANGYFYDIDGQIKHFCCGNTDTSSRTLPHCMHQTGTPMSHYGATAPNILLQTENVTRGEHMLSPSDFEHFRARGTRNRLGGAEQVSTEEQSERCEIYSIRRNTHTPSQNGETNSSVLSNRHHSSQQVGNESLSSTSRVISENHGTCASQTGETSRPDYQFHDGVSPVEPSQECHSEGHRRVRRPREGERTIKEDVNRTALIQENAEIRSRLLCLKCQRRVCNVVLFPCNHLVICDICIENTTGCPKCGKKVNNAVRTLH